MKTNISFLLILLILCLFGLQQAIAEGLFFQARLEYRVGQGSYHDPYSMFASDLDGDTDIDMVTVNSLSDDLSIFINNGDGTFQKAVNYDTGIRPYSIFAIDLDGDNDCDLADFVIG